LATRKATKYLYGRNKMTKLPEFFLDKIPQDIRDKTRNYLLKYLKCEYNNLDHICIVGQSFVINELMNIVLSMSNEELSREEWWAKGFIRENNYISSNTREHLGFILFSRALCTEIYNER
jgi:hypothetical protein